VNFPPEMRALDQRVQDMDREVWRRARRLKGIRYPDADAASPAQTSSREE
jgi:hypothetical protein